MQIEKSFMIKVTAGLVHYQSTAHNTAAVLDCIALDYIALAADIAEPAAGGVILAEGNTGPNAA